MALKLFNKVKNFRVIKLNQLVLKRPLTSFFVALILLFGLIVAGNFLSPKKPEISKPEIVKDVAIYQPGRTPKVSLQAKIDKSGVIKVVALSPGVVSSVNVTVGQQVKKGDNLINLSSNYSGGNAQGLQFSIASKQNQIIQQTYSLQKDLIKQNRQAAQNVAENAEGLREITADSLSRIRENFNLNQTIIGQIDLNILQLQSNNPGGVNDQTILQSRQMKSQFEAANLGLKSQLNVSEYTSSQDSPAAKLNEIQKELALKQLDIQEKTLDLSKQISSLQLALAGVNAEMMHPTAPFSGVVDKIFVHVGEVVNPGTTLLTISGDKQSATVIALVPENIAKNVSRLEPSKLNLNGLEFYLMPDHISRDPTESSLYSVIFNLPEKDWDVNLTIGDYVLLELPVGAASGAEPLLYIPLDTVFQSTDSSYIFVVKGDKAESKNVQLGNVFGKFVEVKKGLSSEDKVIINRNVVAGDTVRVHSR